MTNACNCEHIYGYKCLACQYAEEAMRKDDLQSRLDCAEAALRAIAEHPSRLEPDGVCEACEAKREIARGGG